MSRILLLEDDEALALGIEFTLKDEGYEVTRCATVKEAEETFSSKPFDLALLDVMLPDGNGYDVLKSIRSKSDIPAIFLTACDEEVNVVLGLDLGADDYITKPFRVKELLSRIRAVTRRSKAKAPSETIRSGDIILNTKRAKVLKRDNEISLSSQEYKLLLIFMTNPGKVLKREEILSMLIEGDGTYFDANTVSVYVKRIREKIEDDSTDPEYIKTRRGLGYEWCTEVEKNECD